MDFVENACSKVLVTFADHHAWCSSLLDELLIDERDSDGFILRLVVCSTSDSSYNLTDSSLISVGYQLRFLASLYTRSADLACTWYYYVIACNPYWGSAFLGLLSMRVLHL